MRKPDRSQKQFKTILVSEGTLYDLVTQDQLQVNISMGNLRILIISMILIVIGIICSSPVEEADGDILVAYRGEYSNITAQLLQNGTYGDPVIGETIEFYEETTDILLGTSLTDSQGYATLEWYVPLNHTLGTTLVNATYRGNETLFLAPSCQWLEVTIYMRTKLKASVSDTPLAPGDLLSISAELRNQQNGTLGNEMLELRYGNNSMASAYTNSSGLARFLIHVNDSWAYLGENTLTITHPQNPDTYTSQSWDFVTVIVNKVTSWIDCTHNHSKPLSLGDSLPLNVRLTSTEGYLIHKNLGLYLNGGLYTSLQTNSTGNAELLLIIDESFTIGPHHLEVRFEGTDRYTTCQEIISFDILTPVFVSVQQSNLPLIAMNTTLKIHAHDHFGRSISDAVVQFYDTTSDLQISMNYEPPFITIDFPVLPPKGAHEIGISFTGNPYLSNGSLNYTIYCWSCPEFSGLNYSIEGYAFPGQEIEVGAQLRDYNSSLSHYSVDLLVDGVHTLTTRTDSDGNFKASLAAPFHEGAHNMTLISHRMESNYFAESSVSYSFIVTNRIPVRIVLIEQHIIPPLKSIDVTLEAKALNGSYHNGLIIQYKWLDIIHTSQSNHWGIFQLQLPLPSLPGQYHLTIRLLPTSYTTALNDSILISISEDQVLAAQGVGIPILTLSLTSSSVLAMIPFLRRKYLIG